MNSDSKPEIRKSMKHDTLLDGGIEFILTCLSAETSN